MKLKPELLSLLTLCGIEHDGTLGSIVQATQKAWARKVGVERWEMAPKDFGPEKNQTIRKLAKELGFIDEIPPPEGLYRHCLIHGSILPLFEIRVNFAAALWERGVRFEEVVLLGGDRPLYPIMDDLPYPHGCTNSMDGMRFVYEHAPLPFHTLPMRMINAVTHPKALRPTTKDTIDAWLRTHPYSGKCLFISNQPFVLYQDSVAEAVMPASHPFATVGAATYENEPLEIILDSIARYLYQKERYGRSI